MMNYGHEDYRNRRDNNHNHKRKNSFSDNENQIENEDKMQTNNILSKLSNIFQQQKNFQNGENENNKNDENSKAMTLATLLTLPTNKLEETMNNELITQQSHINSEYFYLFYWFKRIVCFSLKLLLKTLKKQNFLFL